MRSELIDVGTLIKEAETMPPLPASATRLAGLMSSPDWDLAAVCDVIRFDEALTGRLLGAANSARFGGRFEIEAVDQAVMRLGPGTVLSMSIGDAVRGAMGAALPHYGLSEGSLWRHSVAAALAIEESATLLRTAVPPEGFAAALLHDVGKLVLGRYLDAGAVQAMRHAQDHASLTAEEAEVEVLHIGHAELGARVAEAWGLPPTLVCGIRHHHAPLYAPEERGRRLCQEIALADAVAAAAGEDCSSRPGSVGFTPALAGRLGLRQSQFEELTERVRGSLADVLASYG